MHLEVDANEVADQTYTITVVKLVTFELDLDWLLLGLKIAFSAVP